MCVQIGACVCAAMCSFVTLTMPMLMDDSLLLTWRSLGKHLDPRGETTSRKQEQEVKGGGEGFFFKGGGAFLPLSESVWIYRVTDSKPDVTAGANMPSTPFVTLEEIHSHVFYL